MALRRILIANRGEIAARIIRTCRTLGIETVLAASAADRDSLPARLADRTVCIGPARPGDSYLKVDTIVHAALATESDAIHPGYGFLSERAALASACEAEGIVFIGPTAAQMEVRATNCARAPKRRPPTCRSYRAVPSLPRSRSSPRVPRLGCRCWSRRSVAAAGAE